MRADERVAVLTALQKMVKRALDEARAEADEALLAAYEEDGVQKKALKVAGVKVGDYLVILNKGEWAVADRAAFEDFALAYGMAEVKKAIRPEWAWRVIELCERELPEAVCETVKVDPKWQDCITNVAGVPTYLDSGMEVPGLTYTGQTVKATQVRGCAPEKVAPIIARLGGVGALLLGAGEENPTSTL